MIGAPDAARIPRSVPGRAFARTGHGELHELQTAYAGSPSLLEADGEPPVAVHELRFGAPASAQSAREVTAATELERIVAATARAAAAAGLPEPVRAVGAAARADRPARRGRAARRRRGRPERGRDGRRRRRARAPAATPARGRPRGRRQRARLRHERQRQDDVPSHARPRARRAILAGRAPPLRPRLRDAWPARARAAPAHRRRRRGRGRGARRAALHDASSNARAAEAALRAPRRLHPLRVPAARRGRADRARRRAARRLRGVRGGVRACQPRRARRRAAAARRATGGRSASTSRSRPTAAAPCRTPLPG